MNSASFRSRAKHALPPRHGILAAIAFAVLVPGPAPAAEPAGTVRFTSGMDVSALAGRRDADMVEFSNGRRMRVGELRRLDAWGKSARSTPRKSFPAALRTQPAARGRRIENADDLADALKRADSETVQLPSGRLATVGQIRFVQPLVEKQLGRELAAVPQRPDLSGAARKITADSDWMALLQQPDATVLEAGDGTRVTVGELKRHFRKSRPARARQAPAATERR